MAPSAAFCDLPLSTTFSPDPDQSALSLGWVLASGIKSSGSVASGVLSLPCEGSTCVINVNLAIKDSPPLILEISLPHVIALMPIDQKEEFGADQKFKVTEWTSLEDDNMDKPADIILLRMKPTYEKPFNNAVSTPRRVRNSRANASTSGEGEDVQMSGTDSAESPRKVGDTYSPDMLPDHKGPYFSHEKSRLVQRQIKDENGNFIAPHELGTLFSAQVSLSTYINKDHNPRFMDSKVYHVNVKKLIVTILDKGDGAPWNPPPPELASAVPSTPSKRARDPAVDSAFDGLSPSKKARTA
ncbi:hypothetical protein B0H14DRAFT_3869057 [Mycena olivaceomarginata]|nr:hypothetical protein B0H14DRAFT_3869057 [Mycena olivaceomarginata]